MMISILIPSKDEPRIKEMVDETELYMQSIGFPIQIIVANDADGLGKGWAMRQALAQARGEIICFIDGDLDIHPKMFFRLMPFLVDYDVVVGRKQIRGIPSRRIITRASRWFIQALFGLGIDTQTGIKVFKRRDDIPYWDTNGFMFDLEILDKMYRAGKTIIEVPVEANITRKAAPGAIQRCFWEAIKIWSNRRSSDAIRKLV